MDKKQHILIVDDNPRSLQLLIDIIRSDEYVLITVFSGQEAINTAQNRHVDLMLLDVNMPEIDGYEVCRQFKADEKLRDIPILFLSALTKIEDRLKGFQVGGVDYITKPFYPNEVLARVKAHLVVQTVQSQLKEKNTQLQNEINHRKQVEAKLKDSEKRYRLLFEKTNNAVFITGLDFKCKEVNLPAARLLGYSIDEMIGKSYTNFLSPDESDAAVKVSQQLLQGDVMPLIERTFRRKDGSEFLAEINVTLIKDDENQPLYYHRVIHDITARKQLQESLKQSEQRYRDILEHASEAVFTTDLLGFFTFANPVMVKRSGYPIEELIGKHFTELIDESWRDRVLIFYQKQFADRIPETVYSFPLYPRKDEKIWVEQTTNLIKGGDRITGFLGITRDVTKQKAIEAERERLIAELDAFAHTVAHDLKNPLSVLQFSSNVLETMFDEMSEEIRKNTLVRIQASVRKMVDIIDALLLLGGVRKQEHFKTSPLDMRHILDEALERLQPQIIEYKATITITETFPVAQGYAPWVEEVWVNYLSNALKYGGSPPNIEIGTETLPDKSVCFWIKDNGNGVSLADQDKLFIPFIRLNQINIEGHGLGLSIVQRIVEKLGGTAGVESEVGKGSKFYFTLPASKTSTSA